jgi:hypothetical protein
VTVAQTRYLNGVVYPAILEKLPVLADRDDVHNYMLCQYFGSTVLDIFGVKRRKPKRRSQDLTTTEMTDFIEFVIQHAAEHGVKIPTTEEPA